MGKILIGAYVEWDSKYKFPLIEIIDILCLKNDKISTNFFVDNFENRMNVDCFSMNKLKNCRFLWNKSCYFYHTPDE